MNPNDHCLISNLDGVTTQFSIVAIHSSKLESVNHYLREKKNTYDLGPARQNIAETIAFADKRKSILVIQIQEAL